jgi:dinuclear metal center YbgI/SA1388 family protein
MSVARTEVMAALNDWLEPSAFNDYCPNGLQVEGSEQVSHIVSGVTASMALIEQAVEQKADMLLVHHGYFWKGEGPALVGMKYRRIKALISSDINLVAYHLPLDFHQQLGNNVSLARELGFTITGQFGGGARPLGMVGELLKEMTGEQLAEHIEQCLGRKPQHIAANKLIKTVAWCTGAAQNYIDEAVSVGVDAYLSGEISEPTYHSAREGGIHYFGAGHHATERFGVQCLGEKLAQEFGVKHSFIDVPNPV